MAARTGKIAYVLAANLPIQVERQKRGLNIPIPLFISHPVGGATVFAMSGDAAAVGVQVGMSLYHARQIMPSALVVEPDESTYHTRHGAVEAALRAFSPAIETVALGEFLLDARGLEHSHGGDQAIAEALCAAALAAAQLEVRVGLAANKFTAEQAARCAEADGVTVVSPGQEARFLAPLPIGVLPHLPGEIRRRLSLLDIHTLGDLAAIKKVAVLRQFGAEVSSLYELARGSDPRLLHPDAPPLRLVRSLQLKDPVSDRQVLLNVANRLARQMSQALAERGYHAEAIKLTLFLPGDRKSESEVSRIRVARHREMSDSRSGAESEVSDFGQSDDSRLEAGRAVKPPTSDESRLSRLAAQLLGRLSPRGPTAGLALSAYPLRPWHLGLHQMALVQAGVSARQTRLEETVQLLWRRFGQAALRIAALLGPPLPIKVGVSLNAQGHPARVEFGGLARVVTALDEQWREERSWWDVPLRRDYFRVLLADGSLRNLFQDLVSGDWYLDRAWPLL